MLRHEQGCDKSQSQCEVEHRVAEFGVRLHRGPLRNSLLEPFPASVVNGVKASVRTASTTINQTSLRRTGAQILDTMASNAVSGASTTMKCTSST